MIDQTEETRTLSPKMSWRACTDRMGGSTTQMLENLVMPQGVEKALEVITSGQACACTDGSVKDGSGTAAFVCSDSDNPYNYVLKCAITVPKGYKMTSTRAELMGILLIYRAVEAIGNWSGKPPIIYAACDSMAALRKAILEESISASTSDYDIIKEIHECKGKEHKMEWCHVYGHADKGNLVTNGQYTRC